jgi:hypothetical protein
MLDLAGCTCDLSLPFAPSAVWHPCGLGLILSFLDRSFGASVSLVWIPWFVFALKPWAGYFSHTVDKVWDVRRTI